MRARALVVLALLAPALAGCATPAQPAEPAAPAGTSPGSLQGQPGFVNASQAAGAANGANSPSDFSKSLDDQFHTHNYWGGSLEKLLFDADVSSADPKPAPSGRGVFMTLFGLGRGGATSFELPEGSIVPPEANRLDVTVSWASSPTITGLALAYANATSRNVHQLDPLPDGGGTYNITTQLEGNDIPHTTISKWRFALVPTSEARFGLFNGTVHVVVKAYRNDTLYVAPPHHDFWGANESLALLDLGMAAHETDAGPVVAEDVLSAPDALTTGTDADDGFGIVPLPNGTLVPPHTATLVAVLTWTNNATAPDADDLHPQLLWAPANSRGLRPPENAQRSGTQITYTITVDPRMWDSPYNARSQWTFAVEPGSATSDTARGLPANVGQFDGHWHLALTAQRAAVDAMGMAG